MNAEADTRALGWPFELPTPLLGMLLAVIFFGVTGCPHRFKFGPNPEQDPSAVLSLYRVGLASPAFIQGEAKLHIAIDRGGFSANHLVAMRAPGSLRLDTLSFFGNPLAVLVMQDGVLTFWDIEGKQAYQGPATREVLASVIPLGMDPRLIVPLILGRPPRAAATEERLVLDRKAEAYRVDRTIEGSGGPSLEQWYVDPVKGQLRAVHWVESGKVVARVTYSHYKETPQGRLPGRIQWVGRDGALDWKWNDLQLDPPEQDDEVFHVTLPAGVTQSKLGGPLPALLPPEVPAQGVE